MKPIKGVSNLKLESWLCWKNRFSLFSLHVLEFDVGYKNKAHTEFCSAMFTLLFSTTQSGKTFLRKVAWYCYKTSFFYRLVSFGTDPQKVWLKPKVKPLPEKKLDCLSKVYLCDYRLMSAFIKKYVCWHDVSFLLKKV